MILVCPACSARYAVDPGSLGPEGRKVRCARCTHTWFQAPPAPVAAAPAAVPPLSAQPPVLATPAVPATVAVAAEAEAVPYRGNTLPATRPPDPPRPNTAAGWTLLVLLVVGLLTAAYIGRDAIVRQWPPAFRLYETLGIDVADLGRAAALSAGSGLELRDLAVAAVSDAAGPMLRVSGRIANVSDTARAVPLLTVTLTDSGSRALRGGTITVEPGRLEAGDTASFEARIPAPAADVSMVEVTAAEPG